MDRHKRPKCHVVVFVACLHAGKFVVKKNIGKTDRRWPGVLLRFQSISQFYLTYVSQYDSCEQTEQCQRT